MSKFEWALAPRFSLIAVRRFLITLLPLLFLTPLAAYGQGGQNNPVQPEPVVLTMSVSPDRVPMTSGAATLTWSGRNARYCSVDGTARAASGSVTVGPWTTAGAKTILVECWNNGKAGYAAGTVSVTVYSVPKPIITTTLSKSLLEANVDTFDVTYSATNANSCMVGGTKFPASGSATLGPYAAGKHSLTFSCSGDGGSTYHTINWEAINRVSITASASPSSVTANGSSTVRVSWTGSNADSCTLDGASAAKSGSKTFGPYAYSQAGSKSATVSCANRLGSVSKTVTWTVNAPSPTVSATLSSHTVTAGVDRVDLSWASSNSDSCSYGGRTRAVNGTITNLGPFTAGEHSFTVSCTGKGGTTSDTATLTAEKPPEPPTVTVSVNPTAIEAGTETSTLTWSSEHTTSCSRDGNSVATSGSATVGPYDSAGSHSFTVSCTGAGGSASGAATLTVDPPPPPDPPSVTVSLNPTTITAGSDTSALTWSSRNATSCSRDGTTVATSGSSTLGPYATAGTRRFTVSCTGPSGSDSETKTLTVERPAPPSVTVSLNPTTIIADSGTSTLTWSGVRATSCDLDGTTVLNSGRREVGPYSAGAYQFTVTCRGAGGTTSDTASLTVNEDTKPKVTVRVSSATVIANVGKVNLEWSSTKATSCSHDGMELMTSGTLMQLGPFAEGSHDLTVRCTGSDGTGMGTARVTAQKAPDINGEPDTDGDGIVDSMDTDDDNDGMPDACEIKYGFNPRNSVDGGNANYDGDGASNAHECEHDTDPTRTPANTVLTDTDRDGMSDAWELNNRLDPADADDAQHDNDGDGYSNLEEFKVRTDPNWDESHPKSIPESSFGFNDSYTVHVGNIHTGDMLDDILVRNPTEYILPAISDFVLVQQEKGGFEIRDADDYTIPSNLTDISDDAEFVDLNGDGVKDLVLTGLADHITGANDRVVYGNYHERHALPATQTNLPPAVKKFFKEVSAWIDDDKYFIKNAPQVSVPKVIGIEFVRDSQNNVIAQRQGGPTEIPLRGQASDNNCFEGTCPIVEKECESGGSFFCYVYTGDWNDLANAISGSSCASSGITCTYTATPHQVAVEDDEDDPEQDNYEVYVKLKYSPTVKVTVRDFSVFNEDARLLATRYLRPLASDDKSLVPGAMDSQVISLTLEAFLGVEVLNRRLLTVGNGTLSHIDGSTSYSGVVSEILNSIQYVRDEIELPSALNQITEEDKEKSPNKDLQSNLPNCADTNFRCEPEHFSDEQKRGILNRMDELAIELKGINYNSSTSAAIALHNSEFHDLANEIGIEFGALIEKTALGYSIIETVTDFREGTVRIPFESGKIQTFWHNHPNGTPIWEHDATLVAAQNLNKLCSSANDYYIYASGNELTRASAKQMVDIEDQAAFVFQYEALINGVWTASKGPVGNRARSDIQNLAYCEKS